MEPNLSSLITVRQARSRFTKDFALFQVVESLVVSPGGPCAPGPAVDRSAPR